MKKTVTTMLSLALALILVSSLSSGVILAKGPSDNASDRGKERARHHTERQVGVLECLSSPNATGMVTFFDGPDDIILPFDAPDDMPRHGEAATSELAIGPSGTRFHIGYRGKIL